MRAARFTLFAALTALTLSGCHYYHYPVAHGPAYERAAPRTPYRDGRGDMRRHDRGVYAPGVGDDMARAAQRCLNAGRRFENGRCL